MSDYVGKAPLTIVVLKSGAQRYVFQGDPYPEEAADGERDRHHKRGFVGPEDETFDPKTKKWSKAKGAAPSPADNKPNDPPADK